MNLYFTYNKYVPSISAVKNVKLNSLQADVYLIPISFLPTLHHELEL